MNEPELFEAQKKAAIDHMAADGKLGELTQRWFLKSCDHKYSYNFTWLGLPIIQYPQDILALQEIFWRVKPDLIVETGVARGGSLIFHASILELIGGPGVVVGVDIDIREHNRQAIEQHPLSKRIRLIEGSSIDERLVAQVAEFARAASRVVVILDSHHTHNHVFKELQLYSSFVKQGSYIVVFDTVVQDMPDSYFSDRPWRKGDNPKTAVYEFLKHNGRFEIDKEIEKKLLITVAPDGYLRCIKD